MPGASLGITARRLCAAYPERPAVLQDVSFDAEQGAVTALVGPNGSGKSTLLRSLAGLMPFSGEVHMHGDSLSSLDGGARARRVAFVPQRTQLMTPLSVETVVAQGRFAHRGGPRSARRVDREAVDRALAITSTEGFRARPFTTLSGGERQRVLLARALATEAPVLLLDEPTSAQDIRHGLWMGEALRAIARGGATVVVVLHDLREVRCHADRAVLLEHGRVVRVGPAHVVTGQTPVRDVFGVDLIESAAPGYRSPSPREGSGL